MTVAIGSCTKNMEDDLFGEKLLFAILGGERDAAKVSEKDNWRIMSRTTEICIQNTGAAKF